MNIYEIQININETSGLITIERPDEKPIEFKVNLNEYKIKMNLNLEDDDLEGKYTIKIY